MNLDQINAEKVSLGQDLFYRRYYTTNEVIHRQQLEKLRAWPSKVINELGMSFVYENRAKPGSSMQEIVISIEYDLYNGNIEETDLILIGITSPLRISVFNVDGIPDSKICSDLDSRWTNTQLRDLFIQEFVNDYWTLYNWYQSINYLDMLSTKLNGRIIQQYIHSSYNLNLCHYANVKPEFLKITDNLYYCNSILDQKLSFYTVDPKWTDQTQHGFFHPYEIIHDSFAKKLAQKIKERYL